MQVAIGKYASLHANQTFSSACGIANGRVLIGRPLNVRARAVAHAEFKTTKIDSQGILVNKQADYECHSLPVSNTITLKSFER